MSFRLNVCLWSHVLDILALITLHLERTVTPFGESFQLHTAFWFGSTTQIPSRYMLTCRCFQHEIYKRGWRTVRAPSLSGGGISVTLHHMYTFPFWGSRRILSCKQSELTTSASSVSLLPKDAAEAARRHLLSLEHIL